MQVPVYLSQGEDIFTAAACQTYACMEDREAWETVYVDTGLAGAPNPDLVETASREPRWSR
jgi:hypothetical protein